MQIHELVYKCTVHASHCVIQADGGTGASDSAAGLSGGGQRHQGAHSFLIQSNHLSLHQLNVVSFQFTCYFSTLEIDSHHIAPAADPASRRDVKQVYHTNAWAAAIPNWQKPCDWVRHQRKQRLSHVSESGIRLLYCIMLYQPLTTVL